MLGADSRYYAVLFDSNFGMAFNHPFYSLPHYDKRNIGGKMLVSHIIERKKDLHKYAVIYDNATKEPVAYFEDAVRVKSIAVPKDCMKVWVLFKDGTKQTFRQIYKDEMQMYWHLVNTVIKSKENRKRVQYARIYDQSGAVIGEFRLDAKNQLIGQGKYHKNDNT